jgi:hypothetical protein
MIYTICPVAFSKRLESSNFILDIVNRTILSEESINNNIILVRSYLLNVKNSMSYSGQIYPKCGLLFFLRNTSKQEN